MWHRRLPICGFCTVLKQASASSCNLPLAEVVGTQQYSLEVLNMLAGYDVDTLATVSVLGGVYNTGSSSLHLAAYNGHLHMVEHLLQAGANPKLADYRCGCNWQTAL